MDTRIPAQDPPFEGVIFEAGHRLDGTEVSDPIPTR